MSLRRLRLPALLLAGLSLGACTYDNYGYGYGGIAVGYGNGYYDPYYNDYYSYYSGNPYWGWYDGNYYPGTGFYVYDSYRRPRRWNRSQQVYWGSRQDYWRGRDDWRENRRDFRENWRDFRRDRDRRRDGGRGR
jgi:hypothetical protein